METHTSLVHLETLRLMTERAGSERDEVPFLHEDHRRRAQEVGIWAVEAAT
jgi:hypothetical protein